ncbi:hypothetical protein N836_04935 [Leptolyngbya sp. Heron Island J]|uniref:hypothetical protein n=1 Tax=Leptolyngbya sp. Heron Island J TaxID=1385935 RepID=UPI0003B97643|nr:hypothetical protein [Leptolyngbya sp. Heron Island J]ESA36908.1 hypothetical protein N836_04935 [Leptolyngbya sp. Heron Island J]
MNNNRSKSSVVPELSPMQLAELYGFERHQVAWSCPLTSKAPKPFFKQAAQR